jgi:hypothetical protein
MLSESFFSDNLRFNIDTLSYLPRWIIVVIDFAVLMIAFFTYLLFRGTGLDYILIPNSVLYLGVLFELIYYFFGYLEPILE